MKRTGNNTKATRRNRSQGACWYSQASSSCAEAPPKKPAPQEGYREKAAGKKQATLKPTAVTPVAKADPADKLTWERCYKTCRQQAPRHDNQPAWSVHTGRQFTAAVADTSAAIQQRRPRSPKPASWKSSPPLPRRSPRQLELELPSRSNKKASCRE
ncbi:unknown protein [Seminavis robusta]|uniref:Uncharacterized protein n=1 Tax=Seminavis robusta TaxID=568900 RepID=A0A9N8F3J8_9STRA|nr:unknown protein [Seminavis robusta]|eukprot:Sro2998_g341850.1 n/a (157) ;mRNA; f:521-991